MEETKINHENKGLDAPLVNGCASDEDYYDEEYWEGEPNQECEKCGRTYDDIGYDYQYCKACGWDAHNKKWDKPIEPTNADIEMGEADFNGRWI
jgi:hypothetical protein